MLRIISSFLILSSAAACSIDSAGAESLGEEVAGPAEPTPTSYTATSNKASNNQASLTGTCFRSRKRLIPATHGPAIYAGSGASVNDYTGMRLASLGSQFYLGLDLEEGETIDLARAKVKPGTGARVRFSMHTYDPDAYVGGGSVGLMGQVDSAGSSANENLDIVPSFQMNASGQRFVSFWFRQVLDGGPDSFVAGVEVTSTVPCD